MRNATHTTSGGTRALKSLSTRAPPFGSRLTASFQPGTPGFRFLVSVRGGWSCTQNPSLINWHSGSSPHRRDRRIRRPRRLRHPGTGLVSCQVEAVFRLDGQVRSGGRLPCCRNPSGLSGSACRSTLLPGSASWLCFLRPAAISTIYRDSDRMRKVRHHFATRGRPVEITSEARTRCRLMPAHGWPPWRAYLAPNQAPALLRTAAVMWPCTYSGSGPLSCDQPMNSTCSSLDSYFPTAGALRTALTRLRRSSNIRKTASTTR